MENGIYRSLVLVQPRKNRPYITERLLMGRKKIKSNKQMENGTFAPREQMFHFHKILKNLTFQRRPKALVWSKGLSSH